MRLYSAPALADGWAQALRPLVLELCPAARASRWMFAARLCGRKFQEIIGDDDEALRKRLEMMTHIYFVKAVRPNGAAFRPLTDPYAPSLIEQLPALPACTAQPLRRTPSCAARLGGNVVVQAKPWGL